MVRIYVIAHNRPDLLAHQVRSFARHLRDEHRIVVINNGKGWGRWRVRWQAYRLGLRSVRVRDPRHQTANYSHARAIQFTYERFIVRDTDVSMILDHDVFALRPFSARRLLDNAVMAGVLDSRSADGRTVHYLHPSLVLLDMSVMPEPELLSFWPDRVEGIACDVGGHVWEHWCRHPTMLVRTLSWAEHPELEDAELFAGTFVHYRGASDWDYKGAEHHARRTRRLAELLERPHDDSSGPVPEASVIAPGSVFR